MGKSNTSDNTGEKNKQPRTSGGFVGGITAVMVIVSLTRL